MTRLRTGTRLLTAALALAVLPAVAWAEDDAATRKDNIPGGRQRIAPRPAQDGPELAGIPSGENTMPPPSMHGFGMMQGNPLFIAAPPMKANN